MGQELTQPHIARHWGRGVLELQETLGVCSPALCPSDSNLNFKEIQ